MCAVLHASDNMFYFENSSIQNKGDKSMMAHVVI